jgi:GTPase SAR1 family protein
VPNQDSLEYWLKEFQEYADKNAQIALVGSKVDLEENPDTKKMMEEFAAKNNLAFTKVSSKKGINVEKAVQDLVDLISDKYFSETLGSLQSDFRRVDKYFGSSQLTASKITENKRCCLG